MKSLLGGYGKVHHTVKMKMVVIILTEIILLLILPSKFAFVTLGKPEEVG